MPITTIPYSAFPFGRDLSWLQEELEDANPLGSAGFIGLRADDATQTVQIHTTSTPSAAQLAALDVVVAAHDPDANLTPGKVHELGTPMMYPAAGQITSGEVQFTQVWCHAGHTMSKMRIYVVQGRPGTMVVGGVYDQALRRDEAGVPRARVAQTNPIDISQFSSQYVPLTLQTPLEQKRGAFIWLAFLCLSVPGLSPTFATTAAAYRPGFLPVRRLIVPTLALPAAVTPALMTNQTSAVVFIDFTE